MTKRRPNRFIVEVRGGVALFLNRMTGGADGWWWGSDAEPVQVGPFVSSEEALADASRDMGQFEVRRWDWAELRALDRPLPLSWMHHRHRYWRHALVQTRRESAGGLEAAAMTADDTFATWLRANPRPTKPGPGFVGFDEEGRFVHYCTCGEWGSFGYNVSLRTGQLGTWYCREHRPQRSPTEETPRSAPPDFETLCICGLPGVYWRPRRGGGRTIWRCEEHRNQWPDYADEIPLKGAAE